MPPPSSASIRRLEVGSYRPASAPHLSLVIVSPWSSLPLRHRCDVARATAEFNVRGYPLQQLCTADAGDRRFLAEVERWVIASRGRTHRRGETRRAWLIPEFP